LANALEHRFTGDGFHVAGAQFIKAVLGDVYPGGIDSAFRTARAV
jgi:hypothetical protein